MNDKDREAFERRHATIFPLKLVQYQNGVFFGTTQEHYETWQAALDYARKEQKELLERWEEALREIAKMIHINPDGSLHNGVHACAYIAKQALHEAGIGRKE